MSSAPPPSLHALLDETEWVRALARRLVASSHEAEDLAQETMERALSSPPTDGRSLRGWLSVVLTNRLRARRRRPDPALEIARDSAQAYVPSTLETVERAEAHQSVVDAVMSLTEPFRTTVLLRYFEGRGPSEIAALEGVPLATVTSRLTRAHARLREKLQGDDPASDPGLLCLTPLLIPSRSLLPNQALLPSTAPPLSRLPAVPPGAPHATFLLIMTSSVKFASVAVLVALGVFLGSTYLDRGQGPDGDASPIASKPEQVELEAPADLQPAEVPDDSARVEIADEAPAQAAPAPAAEPEAAGPAMLQGTVLRHDGTPAAGASVVVGGFGALGFLELEKKAPKDLVHVETEEDGTFTLCELPEKRVLITAGGAGGAPSESIVWAPGDPANLTLVLRQGVRIYGSVHRSDGSLARERQVRLMQDGGTKDPFGKRLIRFIKTDDQGLFDESALCPGEWGIVSYPDDEELKEIGGTMIDHMEQATVKLKDGEEAHVPLGMREADAVQVSGRVTFAGEPVRGIMQWIRETEDPMGSATNMELSEDGSYSVDLEGPGTWYMRISGKASGEFFPLIPKTSEHRLDFELPTRTLTVRVVDEEGEPVRNARVSLQAVEAEYERGPLRGSDDGKGTGKDGRYTFKGLKEGAYLVGAVHFKEGVAPSAVVNATTDQESPETTFVVRGGHQIHGMILGPEGFPASLAPVWIYDEAGRLLNPVAALVTGGSGTFSTHPLPPGRYSIVTESGLNAAEAVDLVIEDADLDGVELQLEPGAVIAVTSLVSGEPHRALVSASDKTGRLLTGQRMNRNPWQWRRHPFDSTQKHIGPFPPGTYTVSSHVPGVGTVSESVTVVGAEKLELTLRHR